MLQLSPDAPVIARQQHLEILRIQPLSPCRRAHQVAEQRRYDLALFPSRHGLLKRRRTRRAETKALRILLPARRTDHAPSVGFEEPDF